MWAGKWILASAITDINVIENAISQIKTRTVGQDTEQIYSPVVSIFNNISAYLKTPYLTLGLIFSAITLYLCHKNKYKIKLERKNILIYLLISILPIIWLSLAANHSIIHSHFTHRELSISCFAILCMIFDSVKIKE